MGILEASKSYFRRWNDFSGRSSRSEYWFGFLAISILGELTYTLSMAPLLIGDTSELFTILLLAWFTFVVVAGVSLGVRRLHDSGKSGWWYLIGLTGIGIVLLLVWFCTKGTTGANRFGDDTLENRMPDSTGDKLLKVVSALFFVMILILLRLWNYSMEMVQSL